MRYELTTEQYNGPLDKLLELIEEKKLEISRVSMAEVTADFLEYLETLKTQTEESEYPHILADFLVVASKLLLIKSKTLLPSLELSSEEEIDLRDFEARLKLYQELKHTQTYIKKDWNPIPFMFAREFLTSSEPIFYPPNLISPQMLY